jgi:hypothetical protein
MALDAAIALNHGSYEVIELLSDPSNNNALDEIKAARELKKKADELCKHLKCEAKKRGN